MIFFDNSRPDRIKRASKLDAATRLRNLASSPIPPAKSYELLTVAEILTGGDRTLIFDVESYKNYFLVSFKCIATGKVIYFEDCPGAVINTQLLSYILHRFRLVGFNSRPYDLPICLVACMGAKAETLKEISNEIIVGGMQAYEVERKYNVRAPQINHIDLIEVAPIDASLKIYAGRLHCERMQDLPFDVDAELTYEQTFIVRDYNINDLDNTQLLFEHLRPQLELREELGREYGQDLRSKSDAQIAEAIIASELDKLGESARKPTIEPGWQFHYKVPPFISFKTPQFQRALEVIAATPFEIGLAGAALCPQAIDELKPRLGNAIYRLGVGGLHSSEESASYTATDDDLLIDRDVASYYPQIILNLELFPSHLGYAFLKVFKALVMRRLDAKFRAGQCKKNGDKKGASYWGRISDSLKIVINGTFGKLGNKFSKMYSPDLLTQVTMTGQLSLLMLIEAVELGGFQVISANTDGIVIRCPAARYLELEAIIQVWEYKTGFDTEETRYKGLYSRDVNNYIAVKLDNEVKTKGVYSERGSALNSVLSKNPETYICSLAVQAYLVAGTPIAETVLACRDMRQFVSVRTVRGGAEKDGVYLGKAIRWYYAQGETGCINAARSGNKVPKSDGAKPLMVMPSVFPNDVNFDYYINEANDILFDLGVFARPEKLGKLF